MDTFKKADSGLIIYTTAQYKITKFDLALAEIGLTSITDAYFSKLAFVNELKNPENLPRSPFHYVCAKQNELALTIQFESQFNVPKESYVSIMGLDNLLDFFCQTNSLGLDLSAMRNKEILEFNYNGVVIGLGIDPKRF